MIKIKGSANPTKEFFSEKKKSWIRYILRKKKLKKSSYLDKKLLAHRQIGDRRNPNFFFP